MEIETEITRTEKESSRMKSAYMAVTNGMIALPKPPVKRETIIIFNIGTPTETGDMSTTITAVPTAVTASAPKI